MFLTDKHGTFTFVNHAFTAKYGYIPEEVVGKVTPRILKSGSVAQGAYKKFWNEILVGMEVRSEYVNRCKDGTLLDVEGSVSPIYDKEHTIAGFVGVQRDIRERKKAEAELRNYQENLEEMVRTRTKELHAALHKERELGELKSKFVSIASHEFRTPLSTISLAAESVRRYADKLSKEEISRKLLKIEDQVSHMTNLLDDILTIGRSDAGKTTVHSTELNLKEFVMVLMDEVKSSAKEARDIQLNFASDATVIRIDDKLLRNTLNNLLTNALKFSPQNSPVRLSVADESGGIRLDVEDHGIGIAEAELATVFEAFNRGSNATHVQGTGLGLSIVKRAVTLMGGEISVKSVINLGTTFSVWLPLDAG
jgi:PAS domain S-box-containing protein